eukprot:g43064.t1
MKGFDRENKEKLLMTDRSSQKSKSVVLILRSKLDLKKWRVRMLKSCLSPAVKTSLQLIYNSLWLRVEVEAADEEEVVQVALENMLGGEEEYKDRVTNHLIPCIAQFSVAIGDDSVWKPLNYQILLKTRHSSPKVRFSALIMLLELASKLKENYMLLLPETIPFLAELLEDECEEVEHHCQK